MNASHQNLLNVPAHRVVNRQGRLTGKHHFGGPMLMQQLLESEGHIIKDDQIQNFEACFWDPARDLL
jgi:methylated-DNA-protein-cysteine methyltransferase related protein